jgi:phage major head subunit gpT-like protein
MPEISMLPEDADGLSPVERIQARWTREQWHDSNGGPRHRGRSAMMSACAGRITYEDFERELLKAKLADSELALMKAQSPKGPSVCAPRERPTGDVLQAALLCHLGHEQVAVKALGEQATECARQLRCHHMLDIVRAGYNAVGAPIPADRNEMITASASIMSLPGLLGNAAGKLLLDAYQAFLSVARQIAKKLTASDFKAHTGYRLTGDMKFQEVTPDGQIKHGQLAESSYPYRIDTYGRMFGLTRQDIINDDLGAFESMPSIIGRGAAVALEELFWKLVLANTGSFFSGANYLSGGTSVLALTGLGLAVAKMRQQTDAHGAPIVVVPKFLVVPPELEATADALYASTNIIATGTTDATQPDGNPYKGKYQPLVVPHLSNATYSGYSLTAWYLFGSPADVAAFGIAYLNGQESPTVESAQAEFSTLGWNYRGYLDMGVCQIDGKGAVKSAGA